MKLSKMVMNQVIEFLKSCDKAYTTPMYKALGGRKGLNMTLNGFRKNLQKMAENGQIQYCVHPSKLPYWKISK